MRANNPSGVDETDDRLFLLTSPEAATRLRISERTLWTLTDRGDIRYIRIGTAKRYPISELERFVARQRLEQITSVANPSVEVSANQNCNSQPNKVI